MNTILALPMVRLHIGDMSPMREDAVRRALRLAPGSLRALAREAGVSHRLLMLIRDGERAATPRVVAALADALERLASRHAEAAGVLRKALNAERGDP